MKTFNANNFGLSPDLLQLALLQSHLHWKLHPAQLFAAESQAFRSVAEFSAELKPGDSPPSLLQLMKTVRMMCGIPVELSVSMPESVIELWADDTLLYTIEGIAIPSAFAPTT